VISRVSAQPTGVPCRASPRSRSRQGRHAAQNILAAVRGESGSPFTTETLGNLAVLGRGSAIADLGRIRLSGLPGWLVWCFVHILYLIGFRNRFIVLFEWAWAFLTGKRAARLITGDAEEPSPPAR
jgi:NADH dehydrogenase